MIRWEPTDAGARLTIDRPERKNALTVALVEEMREHIVGAPDLRTIVVTGASGTFCAGADLEARAAELHDGDPFRSSFTRLLDAIAEFSGLVIAAVDGPALGAGTQLAAACDLRIAGDTATFGIPAGRLGVHVAAPSVARLCALVGVSAAETMLLTSRTLDADEAWRIGLVQQRAVDALTAADAMARELALHAPLTVAGHKRALRALSDPWVQPDRARELIDACEARAFASVDLQEGLRARVERRDPNFSGQ